MVATPTSSAEAAILALLVVVVPSMIWWNSAAGNGRTGGGLFLFVEGSSGGGGRSGGGLWSNVAPTNVGIAVAVTAMAGIALAATLVYSRRGSLKSPWSRRKRKNALSSLQWKNLFTPDGRLRDGGVKFLKKVRSGGVDPSIREEVWPFLLGVYDMSSSQEERDSIKTQKRKEYEKLRKQCMKLLSQNSELNNSKDPSEDDKEDDAGPVYQRSDSPTRPVNEDTDSPVSIDRDSPQSKVTEDDENQSGITNVAPESSESDSSDETESMLSPLIQKEKISKEEEESPLLSTEPSKLTTVQRTEEDFATWQRIIRLDAVRANAEWIVYSPAQAAVSESRANALAKAVGLKDYDHLEPCRVLHASRLVAILEAYALLDPEIGYCQGMSDLLSPIITYLEDDYLAFWCFVGFMKKARHNFRLDEVGIRRQLNLVAKIIKSTDSYLYKHLQKLQAEDCFFVYRMVVVLFRRELTFEQTVCMWEVMWADQAAIRAGINKSAWGRIRLRAPPSEDLLLFAIAACVLQRRKSIIEQSSSMDEIMRECNSLSGHLDVWKLLDDAHSLVVCLHDKV
ncbi:hypothetical protein ACHQM5_000045 [Ranunculus cassubicifolius]